MKEYTVKIKKTLRIDANSQEEAFDLAFGELKNCINNEGMYTFEIKVNKKGKVLKP